MAVDEQARLFALRELNLLDTPASESFDRITRMAAQLFQLPIAAVSLTDMDRQWFKSRVGVDHTQIPRERAPCAKVAETADVLVLPDLLLDDCYRDSNLAKSGIRFYAGAPLLTRDGYGLGAMCVLGVAPRQVTAEEIGALRDMASMVMAQIELQHAFGRVDPVTGLPNRHQFLEDLEDLSRDHAGEKRFSVLIDVADPVQVKDLVRAIGPGCIDELGRMASRELRAALGPGTKIYQTSSTQYGYLLGVVEDGEALLRARSVRTQVAARFAASSHLPVTLDPVVGIAPVRLGTMSGSDVLRITLSAVQDAREIDAVSGFYSADLDAAHRRRFSLVTEMSKALLKDDQLSLVFQPRVDIRSGRCFAAEALLRWNHPELGQIPPGEFIPVIEKTSLARELTHWVLRAAIEQNSSWRKQGTVLQVSINISASNLEEPDFSDRLVDLLTHYELPAEAIELELTESALIRHGRGVRDQFDRLDQAGISIAIDDFGTGYSSLSYLQQIPSKVLKIDRSFVVGLTEPRTQTLVAAMISIGHDLGYRVVAEGVEVATQLDLLSGWECDEAQGYWYSRPLPQTSFEAWLQAYNAFLDPGLRLSA